MHINFSILHLQRQSRYFIIVTSGDPSGCSGECITNDGCQQTHSHKYDERIQQKHTDTMIVSKDDLENVVQNAVNRLLEKRENKPEVYLSVEETARRLKVDRSTLWRWNKDGYLTTTKVGNKVRYKLSDVERIQKGEVYE